MAIRTSAYIRDFIAAVTAWAETQPDILAIALVGSYARDLASETSDIDLVLLVEEPARYLNDTSWAARFGSITSQQIEDWGMVTSLRVFYAPEPEVEYGFTTSAWAAQPLDAGTRRVIQDGMRVLYERLPLLSPLVL
jgi:predicted nucleotidyltransferase